VHIGQNAFAEVAEANRVKNKKEKLNIFFIACFYILQIFLCLPNLKYFTYGDNLTIVIIGNTMQARQ
jgi:hypothetical protein